MNGGPTDPQNPPPPAAVASVQVAPANCAAGGRRIAPAHRLTASPASPRDAQGNALTRPVTWSSSNPALATVDANGLVRGVAGGRVTVVASAEGKDGNAIQTAAALELELSKSAVQFHRVAAVLTPAAQTAT